MRENQQNGDIRELKKSLEEALDGKVKSIVDYTDEYLVVVMDDPDQIPGRMFKIHKKTGDLSAFTPAMDLDGYFEAVCKRSIRLDQ